MTPDSVLQGYGRYGFLTEAVPPETAKNQRSAARQTRRRFGGRHALLVSAAFHAEQRLLLATPYYVPDEALQEALVLAAKRGLQITLLLPRPVGHAARHGGGG